MKQFILLAVATAALFASSAYADDGLCARTVTSEDGIRSVCIKNLDDKVNETLVVETAFKTIEFKIVSTTVNESFASHKYAAETSQYKHERTEPRLISIRAEATKRFWNGNLKKVDGVVFAGGAGSVDLRFTATDF